MSARLGTPSKVTLAVGAVGATYMRSITISNWAILNTLCATWTAAAGAGNRQLAVRIRDSSNILAVFLASATIPASQTAIVTAGAGLPAATATVSTTTWFTVPIPDLSIPPASTLEVIDLAGVSQTDTLAMTAILVY